MGIHTGDSFTVAPIQTLTDKEYQDHARSELRGDPRDGRRDRRLKQPVWRQSRQRPHGHHRDEPARQPRFRARVQGHRLPHRENRRLSFAVGYVLHKIPNDITRETPASFEPTIDYVVVKVPRFAFEKFAQADPTLNTQMKPVGEAMSIGRTFKESLQKCLRSLEIGRSGLGGDGKRWRIGTELYGDRDLLPRDVISRKLTVPNAERVFFIRHALRAGFTVEDIFQLTKIDRWFLTQIKEIVDFED
jgi:carbamoyl-phosphate synthase large subunit